MKGFTCANHELFLRAKKYFKFAEQEILAVDEMRLDIIIVQEGIFQLGLRPAAQTGPIYDNQVMAAVLGLKNL